jgi:two-component system cell cycle sensor histidine kinase/response regulator CckA
MAKILIIDDDPVFSDMTKQRLERAGHEVRLHLGPFGATVAAGDPEIDLVILDVFMPALNGPTLLDIMRKSQVECAPIVFCSSMDPAPLRKLAEDHRAAGFIPKSVDRAEFLGAVQRALQVSRRGAVG